MTSANLQRLQSAERRRRAAIVVVLLLPWLLVVAIRAWQLRDGEWSWPLLLILPALIAAGGYWAWRWTAVADAAWLAREIDARRRDLEDSADLLFRSSADLPALERLQQARVQERLKATPLPDLRSRWPLRSIVASTLAAIAFAAVAMIWVDVIPGTDGDAGSARVKAADTKQTRIASQVLEVQPHAYTRLPMQRYDGLQAKVAEGSTLRWTLRFEPQPATAELVFHDGSRVALQRRGEDWIATRQVHKPTFYRLELESALPLPATRPHRIDVVADQPPQIKVSEPDRTLIVLERQQAGWPLVFEASDDFGLGAAQLRITLAQGSGENISVSARTMALSGQGDARRRSYRHRLDLAGLGFAAGDDLAVRLSISDNREPSAQTTRSASFILRWPANAGAETTSVEGMVKRVLPAYFRSQRQIIIDSEALLAQRRKLAAESYIERADGIGVDQRLLRLRYGQFLGQETSPAAKAPVPAKAVEGAGDQPISETSAEHAADDDEHAQAESKPSADGGAAAVLETFAHTHDQPEAATLLDPDTRALLKSALDEMWQAELHLRQGDVAKALPYEYRALRFIKQVQQASRIYLARVGVELPPIDESRRLTGDRSGLQARRDALKAAQIEASPALALWQTLDVGNAAAASAELDAFERWLRARETSLPDALDLFAALDAVRREPDCRACVANLRARLWSLLPPSAPAVDGRRMPDRSGRAYLDSLKSEAGS